MNCVKGDIAMIRIPNPINDTEKEGNGRIVVCEAITRHRRSGAVGWIVSPTLVLPFNGKPMKVECVIDAVLFPIRPGNEPDETLSWAPVPGKITEKV